MDSLVGAGTVREFLIVMPDGSTQLGGSHYTSSATNGDWEKFLARELVDHVDRTYRTIRRATSDREVFARWERQSVLALVSAHPAALRSLKGLAFDVGDSDQFGFAPQVQSLDSLLNSLAVPHMFDEYHGRHSDKVPERMTAHVLPFFSGVLEFEDTASH
jgi:enterochelin esterase-like enzyme